MRSRLIIFLFIISSACFARFIERSPVRGARPRRSLRYCPSADGGSTVKVAQPNISRPRGLRVSAAGYPVGKFPSPVEGIIDDGGPLRARDLRFSGLGNGKERLYQRHVIDGRHRLYRSTILDILGEGRSSRGHLLLSLAE